MDALIEIIKKIGIFMIAAQALVHFAPGQKYEKYMKLIVGIVILFQFIKPVYALLTGTALQWNDWNSQSFLQDYEDTVNELTGSVPYGIDAPGSVAESVIVRLEEEIKSKLNREMGDENYRVVNVKVAMKHVSGNESADVGQYELERVHVAVRRVYYRGEGFEEETAEGGEEGEGKIGIQKISIDIGTIDGQGKAEAENERSSVTAKSVAKEAAESAKETEQALRERFCMALGMEEEQMEVSVYGELEENAG